MLSRLKRRILKTVDYHLDRHISADLHDIHREQQREALRETASFVNGHLTGVRSFRTRDDLLVFLLGQFGKSLPGLCLEFGVYRGASINLIATSITGVVHGFDSFEGLPENWREGHDAGTFSLDALPSVRDNVVLHKGWFKDTLPPFLEEHREPISFVHVDCDLYSSTKFVLDAIVGRLSRGSVLVFDEYFNYAGWQEGEHKAFVEFQNAYDLKFEYIAYNSLSEQVAVSVV